MNTKLKALIIGFGIIMSLLVSGCVEKPSQNGNSVNTSSSATPFFPTQKNYTELSMLALLEGKLLLEDGCLRVDDNYNSYLPVWPYGFSLNTDGDVVTEVIDATGHPVARVGDKIKLGGGEIPHEYIVQYSAELPSDRCSGPYWIVGEVIPNKLDYTQEELKDLYLKHNITENDIKFARGELPNFLEGKTMKGNISEMHAIEEEARKQYIEKYGVDPGNPKLDEVHGILIPVEEVKRLVKIGRLIPSE
ncbi:MAG: hypothetical protein SCH70_10885 [Candidatus Methanoperedens sp.]|nr:hypothetical protein [Candidatus Methanoperedens sp.]